MKYILPSKKLESFSDNILTFSESSFNSFSASTCFVLFEVIFSFKSLSLSTKSLFFTKVEKSFFLAKFACVNP